MKTGELIRNARKKADLTQKELGEKIGVTGAMIGQYETGVRNPKQDTLQKLANALGVRWYELYSDSIDDQVQAVSDFIWKSAEKAGILGTHKPFPDLFTEMFSSTVIQELGRRGVKIQEEERKEYCEKNGIVYIELTEPFLSEGIKAYIVNLLLAHRIYPDSFKSLLTLGFSKGDAFAIMNTIDQSTDMDLSEEQEQNDDVLYEKLDQLPNDYSEQRNKED